MIFQFILIGMLGLLAVYAMTQRRKSAPTSYLIIALALGGM